MGEKYRRPESWCCVVNKACLICYVPCVPSRFGDVFSLDPEMALSKLQRARISVPVQQYMKIGNRRSMSPSSVPNKENSAKPDFWSDFTVLYSSTHEDTSLIPNVVWRPPCFGDDDDSSPALTNPQGLQYRDPLVLLSYEHSTISLARFLVTHTKEENTRLRGHAPNLRPSVSRESVVYSLVWYAMQCLVDQMN